MLNRRKIRRYMIALLSSDEIPQGPDCEKGPIWEGCEDLTAQITDSETGQLQENVEKSIDDSVSTCVFLDVNVEEVSYNLSSNEIDNSTIRFQVSIGAIASTGEERVEILDDIEEKILYRFFTAGVIIDAEEGTELPSPLRLAKQNTLTIKVTDDNSYGGDYTIREMLFTLASNECIKTPNCDVKALCFDFSKLTILHKENQDHA